MTTGEVAIEFPCLGETLTGIFHPGHRDSHVGVVVVVGGPQYRVGSHRQFVLLARVLAQSGIPVLRFDSRGMGDSSGELRTFENVNKDIGSAVTLLVKCAPTVQKVVIWGLCDAASAALFYAPTDTRVMGLVLLNPWVRTEAGMARAYLKHYYLQRLLSRDFWKKVLSGKWRAGESLKSISDLAGKLQNPPPGENDRSTPAAPNPTATPKSKALPERMLESWENYHGKVLLVLSGNNDYVADEFRDVVKASRRWRKLLKRSSTTRFEFTDADHTFSCSEWRNQVSERTRLWISGNF